MADERLLVIGLMRIVQRQPQFVELRLIELQHLVDGFLAIVLFDRVRFGRLSQVVASGTLLLPRELTLFLRTRFAPPTACRTHCDGSRPVYASSLSWAAALFGTFTSGLNTPLRWSSVNRPWIMSNAASGRPCGMVASCPLAFARSQPCRS